MKSQIYSLFILFLSDNLANVPSLMIAGLQILTAACIRWSFGSRFIVACLQIYTKLTQKTLTLILCNYTLICSGYQIT